MGRKEDETRNELSFTAVRRTTLPVHVLHGNGLPWGVTHGLLATIACHGSGGSLRIGVDIAVKAWPPKVGKTVWILDKQQYAEGTLSQLRNCKARALPEHRGGSRGKDPGPAVRVQSGSP